MTDLSGHVYDHTVDYPKDTLGYHWNISRALFGETSRPVQFLEDKASQSANGMYEQVVLAESQVVQLLVQMSLSDDGDQPFIEPPRV